MPLPDKVLFQTQYQNSENLPKIFNYLKTYSQVSSSEYFNKTAGFNLIPGMTYRVNARVPKVDYKGQVFFTAKTVREWTYGQENAMSDGYLFEQTVVAPEFQSVQLSIVMKNLKVSVPFEAQVHFEGTTFTQSYSGVWNGFFAYEYEVINGNQGSSY